MIRKGLLGVSITVLFILAFGHVPQTSAPIKLARHPDYHAGKIVFSYLGDIWMANDRQPRGRSQGAARPGLQ